MKPLLSLSLAALGLTFPAERISTRYEAGQGVRVTASTTFGLELTEMTRNGERVAGEGGVSETLSVTFADRWLEADGGRPTKVRRTFEEVGGEAEVKLGEESRQEPVESPFAGVVVELTRDEKGEVACEVVEGEAPDEAALEALRLELDLDALLPEDEVAAGESWDLDAPRIRRALGFELAEVLFPRPAEEEGAVQEGRRGRRSQEGSPQRPLADAEWSGTAKLDGEEEHDGERCLVLALELEASRDLGNGAGASGSFEAQVEGKLLFSVEARRPVKLELSGTLKSVVDIERERRGETVKIHRASEGTFEQTVELEELGEEK